MLTFQIYLDRQNKRFNDLVFDTLSESEMGKIFNLIEDYATEKIDECVGRHMNDKAKCSHCGDEIDNPLCRSCEIQLTLPTEEY